MSQIQLKFKFESFKVGDLVKQRYQKHPLKTHGVVLEVDKGENTEQVKVHWPNWGTYWTISEKLSKVNSKND
jgi:hypothetical protein